VEVDSPATTETFSALLTATVTATAVNYGERRRTMANDGGQKITVLKTTKVQAFGGSNPSPSVFGFPLSGFPS
jgi:hypothetical protein